MIRDQSPDADSFDLSLPKDADPWPHFASQSLVWSFLLVEIPLQVRLHVEAAARDAEPLVENLDRYWKDAADLPALRAKLDPTKQMRCEIGALNQDTKWACTVARISRRTAWPSDREISVEFAICREGDLKVRCLGIDKRKALDAFVEGPRRISEARNVARRLVLAAIKAVDAEE